MLNCLARFKLQRSQNGVKFEDVKGSSTVQICEKNSYKLVCFLVTEILYCAENLGNKSTT